MRNNKKCKKIRKDYQEKKLSNPFFRKKEKPKKTKKGIKLKVFILSFSLIILLCLIFSLPFLNISKIEIEGLSRLPESEIISLIEKDFHKKSFLIFSQQNIFSFKKKAYSEQILNDHNFAKVEIKKRLPSTLVVKIDEKPYAFIYNELGVSYFSSTDYFLIDQVDINSENEEDIAERNKYFTIVNESDDTLIENNAKLDIDENYLQYISDLNRELANYPGEINLDYYIIPDIYFKTLVVKTLEGPQIKFNVNSSITDQIEQLILVKKEEIKDNFNKLDYIDLRYGKKIYFFPENINN